MGDVDLAVIKLTRIWILNEKRRRRDAYTENCSGWNELQIELKYKLTIKWFNLDF